MTLKTFIPRTFSQSSLDLIWLANDIIDEYAAQGFDLTLRQLYYQFVARDLLPNSNKSYKRLGSIINDARLAGMVSWEAIKDRTRGIEAPASWDSPADILESAAYSYREDKWTYAAGQLFYPEVWVEKEALAGVVEQICERLEVPYLACRGYVSQSEMWESRKRLLRKMQEGMTPIILHLGDHDPSGIDMTRDNVERLSLLTEKRIIVKRLALNYDQVEEYNPPPNPAKLTDSRSSSYVTKHGYESWELDALDPRTLQSLIEEAVKEHRDQSNWDYATRRQEDNRQWLRDIAADKRGD